MGMSIFFTLSGFLITQTLLQVADRRVVPHSPSDSNSPVGLAGIPALSGTRRQECRLFLHTLLFTINYEFRYITDLTAPFWSLCVEMHFYFGVALLVLLFGPSRSARSTDHRSGRHVPADLSRTGRMDHDALSAR